MFRVLKYFRNYRLRSVLSPLFKLSEAVFELIVPLVIADIIDKGIPASDSVYIRNRVLLLLVFAVVGFVSAIMAQYFAATVACDISSDLRRDLFNKIQRLSVTEYEKLGSSKIVTGLTSDVNQIQSGINLFLRLLLRSPFIVFGAVIMAFTISVRLALIFVSAVLLLGIVVALNMRSAIPAYKKSREALDVVAGHADNGLQGVRVIRGFNRSGDDYKEFMDESFRLYMFQKAAAKVSSYLNPLTFLIINASICLLIYRGGVNVSVGRLSQGQVVALYNYMSQILVELIKLANLIITVSRAVACAGRAEAVLDLKEDDSHGTKVLHDVSGSHSLEFKNVCFGYEGSSENVLNNISFSVDPGQIIGVIGMTGSGKSTIAALASGIYRPTSGSVLIDGESIDEYSKDTLSSGIGICLQKASMYTGSILHNVSLGRGNVDRQAIDEACTVSLTDDVYGTKKEGIDYEIGSNGAGLSGGQKQRIGIARTLAGRPGLLIFDDSTSALDAVTERKFLSNLRTIKNRPTVILISQKIRSVKNCDKIMLLEDGVISAFAPHNELCRTSQVYKDLIRLQSEGEDLNE
ncbi:MAG: ABC transporter ATP-binding protein/permease [Saccharofermentans sp.]|nr:ABC transporter ATP-binding protein/permease [Saccharofermentans sp.]